MRGVAATDENIGTIGIEPCEQYEGALPVLLLGLTLPCKDINILSLDDTSGGMILGGVDVASVPSDLGAKGMEGLDEDISLDGHAEGTRDAGTGTDTGFQGGAYGRSGYASNSGRYGATGIGTSTDTGTGTDTRLRDI